MSHLISTEDRGLLFGDGVFDTLAVHNRVPIMLEDHIARLVRHAAKIHIAIDAISVRAEILGALQKYDGDDCILRTTLTRGTAPRGLWPYGTEGKTAGNATLICHTSPFQRAMIGAPARLIVSSIARNETSPTSQIKSLNYLDHVLAARDAQMQGADDALLLNTKGNLACTTIGNIFVLKGDVLSTPPQSDGALDGIVRAVLLGCELSELRIVEQSISQKRAMAADAIFVTNSLRLIRPVTRLNERNFEPSKLDQTLLSFVQARLAQITQ
jgi:branched-chain amino acid aminotransferase